MIRTFLSLFFILTVLTFYSYSQDTASSDQHHSKYAGQEKRTIKTLSPEDIRELQQGDGWGLAKAAELNGMPGPRHVLDMESEIKLTENQKMEIEEIFQNMKNEAVSLGKKLIEKEKTLNEAFSSNNIDQVKLKELLMEIAHTRYELRFVHLKSHLQTNEVLNTEQVNIYKQMRGYGLSDPCKNVPEGHDPDQWRRHNNCN